MKKDLFSIFPIFLFLYSLLILIELCIPIYSYNEMWNAIVVFMDLFFPLRLAFKIQKEFLKIVLENRTFMDSYDAFSPYPCIEPFIHSVNHPARQSGSLAVSQFSQSFKQPATRWLWYRMNDVMSVCHFPGSGSIYGNHNICI